MMQPNWSIVLPGFGYAFVGLLGFVAYDISTKDESHH